MLMLVNQTKVKLVIGAGTDDYVSYSQKGSHQIVEGTIKCYIRIISNI